MNNECRSLKSRKENSYYSELNRSDNQNIQVLANVDKKQATSAFDKAAGRRDTNTQVQKSSNEKVTTVSEKNNGVVVAVEPTQILMKATP
ncbi:hypothetical protein [Lactococcus lactis]|uniref:Uncharacterized protein n=1 Tax=Lactococcus lactis subsp. lactis TaxID=1360 RepID=A0A0V8E8J9_LACLL|nr:hypothetical protein [Lactococcus lactis]KSU22167.1 hypothetical protein M20_0605 [Lactococcus lactis subsp. lactis]